jgi:hypothetical protein
MLRCLLYNLSYRLLDPQVDHLHMGEYFLGTSFYPFYPSPTTTTTTNWRQHELPTTNYTSTPHPTHLIFFPKSPRARRTSSTALDDNTLTLSMSEGSRSSSPVEELEVKSDRSGSVEPDRARLGGRKRVSAGLAACHHAYAAMGRPMLWKRNWY